MGDLIAWGCRSGQLARGGQGANKKCEVGIVVVVAAFAAVSAAVAGLLVCSPRLGNLSLSTTSPVEPLRELHKFYEDTATHGLVSKHGKPEN